MRIFALLSWYDEQPTHLRRLVRSLEGFVDVLVAVDGAYATFPNAKAESPKEQQQALWGARCEGLKRYLVSADAPWPSEVAKRAQMFESARNAGATPDDWLMIIDGDMTLGGYSSEARALLAASDRDVAEVRWHDVMINGQLSSVRRFRSMFRALPGLAVERTHYLYTVPCEGAATGRRFLWLRPDGHPSDELTLDLFSHVTLEHMNSQRDPERSRRARDYYQDRDARTLESAGDWRPQPGRYER